MEERISRVKKETLMGWDKDSLIGKAKATCAIKAKQGIHSLLPIVRQVFNRPQDSRVPSRITITWEDEHHPFICVSPPLVLLPPSFTY